MKPTHHDSKNKAARRAGFTLIEAISAIVVLSLVVPVSVAMLGDAARARADAVSLTRATVLAQAVLEQVCADTTSTTTGLGMEALDDADEYLDNPATGLVARMDNVTEVYDTYGIQWTLEVGEPVGAQGVATGDEAQDLYRYVEAVVSWVSPTRGARSLRVGLLAGDGGAG